jgi:hypothetical protein
MRLSSLSALEFEPRKNTSKLMRFEYCVGSSFFLANFQSDFGLSILVFCGNGAVVLYLYLYLHR